MRRRVRHKPNVDPDISCGVTNVLGVLPDDKTSTLWVCQHNTGRPWRCPVVGQTALRIFDLSSGATKGTWRFATNDGVCNDMAVAPNGTVYATESFNNRGHRLRPGATALDEWITHPKLAAIDWIALLADGAVSVNTFFSGELFRIPVNADGSAGAPVTIETLMPLTRRWYANCRTASAASGRDGWARRRTDNHGDRAGGTSACRKP